MDLRPHDLLRLAPDAVDLSDGVPAWAARGLARREPWVVVRRAVAGPGKAAVGVRGSTRSERWALSVPLSGIQERVTPEALAWPKAWRTVEKPRGALPAFVALELVAEMLEERGLAWGPAGGVGYELASGLPVVTEGSDLDLILRCPEPLPRMEARDIFEELAALPARVDAQIEARNGSVALAEWAGGGPVLLRRAEDPILAQDPWGERAMTLWGSDAPAPGHRP